MPKVLCTSINAEEGPHLPLLREAGFDVEIVPRDVDLFVEDNLVRLVGEYDAIVAGSEPYTRRVIEAAQRLRVIARTGVGFDAIDLDACDRNGVVVAITPGVNHHAVAEHTLALLLGVARGFPLLDRQVHEGVWQRVARPRVMGRTLGVVGLGRIGRAVAWRAVGLGMQVLAYEPYPDREFVEQWRIELTTLDDLFARSDYVSLHCPMSIENRHLINADSIEKMKPGAVLINTSRGGLVDERALCRALQSGRLRAAGLDVFETEPLPLDSPLLRLDNVLLSGHVAVLDEESHRDTFELAARIIIDLKIGEWPTECIQNLRGASGWMWKRV
jgi:D-3-phosphoglycerate dehydrogenase / 2-oxoglutarate reductase